MNQGDQPLDDNENWLHEEWTACPACKQPQFRIDQTPLDNSLHFYCDQCPIRVDVVPYGSEYEQIVQFLGPHPDESEQYERHRVALHQGIEERLVPCTCGGKFRFLAPRRCFSCAAPVLVEDVDGVDLYLNDDGFSHDDEQVASFEVWRTQFMRDRDDIWKAPSRTDKDP